MRITPEEVEDLAAELNFKGDMRELRMGIEEEDKEHRETIKAYSSTNPLLFAASIAIDHLNEDPYYYTKLDQLKTREYRIRNAQKEGK